MANISFQLNNTSFANAANAIANWGTGSVITVYADAAGSDIANGEIVYTTLDPATGDLTNPFNGGNNFFAFEKSDGTIAAIEIDASGVAGSLTTTTTTSSTTTTSTTTTSTTTTSTTTTAAPSIEWDSIANISQSAAGGVVTKSFTIQNNSTNFNANLHISISDAWVTATSNTTTSGGTVNLTIAANNTASTRTATVQLLHPENNTVTSTIITITQGAGNILPEAPDFNVTIIQGTTRDLDFSSGSGWTSSTGGGASDTESSFAAGTLSIVMSETPANGSVADITAQAIPLSGGETLANNSGQPGIRYTAPQSVGVNGITDQFEYSVDDGDGGVVTGLITVNVTQPTNQAPVPNAVDISFINNAANIQKFFSRSAQDDGIGGGSVNYDWCLSDGTTQTLAQINSSLLYGTISNTTGESWVYTTNSSGVRAFGDPSLDETIFYFKATDQDGAGESAVGQVSFTLTAPGNNKPVFDLNPINVTVDQYSTVSQVIQATDTDGDTITFSISQSPTQGTLTLSNPTTGSVQFNFTADFAMTTQQETQQFQLQAFDGLELADTPLTVNVTINKIDVISVRYSLFQPNEVAACEASKQEVGYIDALQAGTLQDLAVNDSIYVDSDLNTSLVSTTLANRWVGVQDLSNSVSRAIEIDGEGAIVNVVECQVTLGNAWPITVSFDEDVNDLCLGTAEYSGQIVYQNIQDFDLNPSATPLKDVVNAGGQLFTDVVVANTYLNNTAPANLTVNSGYYSDYASLPNGKYFEFQQGAFIDDGNGKERTCPVKITYQTYNVGVYYSNIDRIRVDNVCLADASDLTLAKLWFRANELDDINSKTEEEKLSYILAQNIVVFTSEEGANALDYDLTWDSTTFLSSVIGSNGYELAPTRKFAIWENYNFSGYEGNFTWKGVDNINGTTLQNSSSITVLGQCSTQFERPAAHSTFNINTVFESRKNVFYAFLSCVAKFEDGSPYWSLYVVDGLHDTGINSSSYIKELVDTAGTGAILNGDTMLECVGIQHRLNAVNLDDAIDILNQLPEYSITGGIRPIQINPASLGFTSDAVIQYGYTDCAPCLMDKPAQNTFTLATVDNAEIINRSIPNFDLEKNYSLDDISKPLLRTNPKLSTNAKLVVDSTGELYLEAIEASKELASVEYKKWPVNKDGQWSYDLHRFFKNTKTPSDLIYQVKESYSNFAVQDTFENQIEEDYHYGTVYNYSKIYDEDFRMLAPIWLDKNIPSKFVIFRVKDPVGTLDFDSRSNLDNIEDILKNSEIIKTFDLTRKSKLGTYIRNHIQSESFPKTPITMNFDKTQRSSFNGIDLAKGGFSSKGEYLDTDLIKQDSTLISANQLITSGFERNKLACANLINLEFMFDDNLASDYSINRYFGLYVNDIESGYGTLESVNNGKLKFKSLNSYINNNPKSAIPPFKLISETPTLGFATTSDNFYKIASKTTYNPDNLEINVEDSTNSISSEIKLAQTGNSIDIKTDTSPGFDFVKVQVIDIPEVNDGFAIFPSKEQSYRIKFTRLIPQTQLGQEGWNFTIVNPNDGQPITFGPIYITSAGIEGVADYIRVKINEVNGFGQPIYPELSSNLVVEVESDKSIVFYEKRATLKPLQPDFIPAVSTTNSIVRIEELQVPYDIDNNTFFALDSIPAGGFGGVNFSRQGTIPQITSAIVKSINSVDNGFTAVSYDGADHFYIKTKVQGYRLLSAGIAVPNANANQWISVDSNNLDLNNELRLDINTGSQNTINQSSVYYFKGGNQAGKSVLVTLDSAADVNVNDFINTKTKGIYNKIIDIVDDIERLPLQYKKIVLEKTNTIEDGEVKTYADNIVKLGLFSAFDIHDMNFDFYDTANSDLKELIYETGANIRYEPEQDDSNDIYPFGDKDNTEYTLDPVDYFSGLNDILLEEQADVDNNSVISSEFDRLQENYLKEYAIRSRVVPSINKWVLKDTLTVREQPYYLNVNEAFGRSNFAPDLTANGRSRLGMTHEWFYINNLPSYFKENSGSDTNPVYNLNDSFSYINFMDGFDITPDIFKDTNYDYFDRLFVTEGFEIKADNNYKTFVKTNRQKKYTKIDGGNSAAFASTIFKGLKFNFKNRKEFSATNPVDFIKSPEFNGYRFSTLLNVKTAQDSNGIEYEVIQNKKFKFVVFLISLSLDDLWADGTLNRKLLYELNHSLVWKQENLTFDYSDIKLDGALDLYSANLTDPNADDYLVVNGYTHADGSIPQFLEQINKNDDSAFGNIIVKLLTPFDEMYIKLTIARLDGQDTLVLTQPPTDLNDVTLNLQNIPVYLQSQAEYTYERGGINAYKSILDSLAAKDVAEMLLRNPNNVRFTSVDSNGNVSNNKFVINIEDGTEVIKESYVVTIPDTDKPESFKLFTGNIGYSLDDGFVYYPFLIRQNGNYTVDTRPVVTFTDVYSHMKTNTLQVTSDSTEIILEEQMYKHSLTDIDEINLAKDYYRRYNRCGVAFNLGFIYDGGQHDGAWGHIKNHFYRKVNEFNPAAVTKLSTSTDKLPLYPLIGEVAIDKKDINVFKSSWDKNYYTRSLSGGNTELVPGTFETKEERSYLASTIMKVKDSYTLLNFTQQVVTSEEEQDQILFDNNNETDLVIFEDADRVVVDFYITKTISDKLASDGVLNAIQRYVNVADSAEDKTTLEDDAELYIEENLVNLFGLNQIKLYTIRIKGQSSSLENSISIDNLDDGGYAQDQNFTFKPHEQKPLNFRLIYNKRLGYSYRIRPYIKITS